MKPKKSIRTEFRCREKELSSKKHFEKSRNCENLLSNKTNLKKIGTYRKTEEKKHRTFWQTVIEQSVASIKNQHLPSWVCEKAEKISK